MDISDLKKDLDLIIKLYQTNDPSKIKEQLLDKGKAVVSIISKAIERKYDGKTIVTGGLSVEHYTQGNYTTQDIDIVIDYPIENSKINDIMLKLGFIKASNRSWILEELYIYIEKVGDSLFDGKFLTPISVELNNNYSVYFVNVNDIIIDRIKGIVAWSEHQYYDQVLDMLLANPDHINYEYILNNLNPQELLIWKKISDSLNENSIELKIRNLIKYLDDNNIHYIIQSTGEENERYIIAFLVQLSETRHYLEFDTIDKNYTVVYNEEKDQFIEALWPYNITSQWSQYNIIHDLLKEGDWI